MSWSLRKWASGSGEWTKRKIDFQYPQGAYFLEKGNELSKSVAFDQNLTYITDQNGPKGGLRENKF